MGRSWVRRDIFLKIEPLAGYSPLAPIACSRRWGRDAMFGIGHELGRVQPSEIDRFHAPRQVFGKFAVEVAVDPIMRRLHDALARQRQRRRARGK